MMDEDELTVGEDLRDLGRYIKKAVAEIVDGSIEGTLADFVRDYRPSLSEDGTDLMVHTFGERSGTFRPVKLIPLIDELVSDFKDAKGVIEDDVLKPLEHLRNHLNAILEGQG
jgi:hypothetical protein